MSTNTHHTITTQPPAIDPAHLDMPTDLLRARLRWLIGRSDAASVQERQSAQHVLGERSLAAWRKEQIVRSVVAGAMTPEQALEAWR